MKRFLYVCFLFFIFCIQNLNAQQSVLWYHQPASQWNEALPLGNGHLGAMVYGNPIDETIQLNDNTLYSGEPLNVWKGLNIQPTYGEVVKLLQEEKYAEANDFVLKNWMGRLPQSYQPLGKWSIKNHIAGEITDYKRELNLKNAIQTISYKQNGAQYTREVFASYPDDIIVMRLRCDKKGGLDITTSLSSIHPTATQKASADGIVAMSGQAPGYVSRRSFEQLEGWGFQSKHPELFNPDGSRKFNKLVLYGDEIDGMGTFFETRIQAILPSKGTVKVTPEGLRISGTNEIILILSSATSYNGFKKSPSREGIDAAKKANEILQAATRKKYNELSNRHVKDYQNLYDRVEFTMPGTSEQESLPTDERICRFSKMPDLGLVTMLFQYGRYLMISGSRPGGQAMNLQGIWNDKVSPDWGSAYTMNINTEMNYWPAELTNLSECHSPLFQMIKEIAESGSETAKNMYGRRGWVGHHNVSIWRETYPNDGYPAASYWPLLSPWLCSHLWEHYVFNGDETFLREEAYPLMKGASEFFVDWLIDNGKGYLVTPVSTSPENYFFTQDHKRSAVSQGCTMDMALIRELFSRTAAASEKLGIDAEFRQILREKQSKLLPYQIGSKGQLQEWEYDFEETEPQHRHLSHLYGIYPGNQINMDDTPDLLKAVTRSMEMRGDAATGWSMGWKINIWARIQDGDHAYKIIKNLFQPVGFCDTKNNGGGLYPNLLDAHPPFQIDGNFGYAAGVTELLLQSHAGFIQLLPALPSEWKKGKISGIKARGGFVVDLEWDNNQMKTVKITSLLGGNCRLRTSGRVKINGKEMPSAMGKNYYTVDFETEKGKSYAVSPLN